MDERNDSRFLHPPGTTAKKEDEKEEEEEQQQQQTARSNKPANQKEF